MCLDCERDGCDCAEELLRYDAAQRDAGRVSPDTLEDRQNDEDCSRAECVPPALPPSEDIEIEVDVLEDDDVQCLNCNGLSASRCAECLCGKDCCPCDCVLRATESPPQVTSRRAVPQWSFRAHGRPRGTTATAPAWGSSESTEAAALLREAPTDHQLQAKRARVMERAASAGLLGIHERPTDVFTEQPSAQELHGLRELRAATQQIVHEAVDPGRLQSALTHWELWRAEAPARKPLLPLSGEGSPGREEAERYNAESFELFTASCTRQGSLRPGHCGQPIAPDTIAGYVSALRAFLSRDGGIQMRSARHDVRTKALSRGIRRARGPAPPRKKRVGLRARQLRAATANSRFDRTRTWANRRQWAAAVIGHALVARGCELSRAETKAFCPKRGLTWRNIEWHADGTLDPTHPALTVHLCAAKDGEGRGPRFPMQIRRRAAGNEPASDALCGYDLMLALWRSDEKALGETLALDTPIFRRTARGGTTQAYSTSDVRRIVREIAVAAGEDPAHHGAHSLRIGGASDFRDLYDTSTAAGLEEVKRVLLKRGRWKGDIAFIYARTSLDSSLQASARLADVSGRDVESAFAFWAEPAR